jgi:ATP-dependent Clp protease ATP-binding subunit ClpC
VSRPFSIVLFDELEKAHPDVFNTLLQILEDGRLTDGQGRVVDFKNTVIILTTNLGTSGATNAVGFQGDDCAQADYDRMRQKVNDELKQRLRPELRNRIDDTIVFHQLDEETLLRIADIMIERISAQLRHRDMNLRVTAAAKRFLVRKDWDPAMGARPLRRTIQREIEDPLSERILLNELLPGYTVIIDGEADAGLVFTIPDGAVLIGRAQKAD